MLGYHWISSEILDIFLKHIRNLPEKDRLTLTQDRGSAVTECAWRRLGPDSLHPFSPLAKKPDPGYWPAWRSIPDRERRSARSGLRGPTHCQGILSRCLRRSLAQYSGGGPPDVMVGWRGKGGGGGGGGALRLSAMGVTWGSCGLRGPARGSRPARTGWLGR
jgi:hypothetical protein